MRLNARALLLVLCGALLTGSAAATAQDDTVRIDWPPSVYHLTGTVEITGTVNPPGLRSYFLEVAAIEPQGAEPFWLPVSLPSSAPVTSGVIAAWDTTLLDDGLYSLRLRAALQTGAALTYTVTPLRIANTLAAPPGIQQPLPSGPPAATAPPPPPTPVPRPSPVNTLPLPVGGHVITFNPETVTAMQSAGMTWMKWQIPFEVGNDALEEVALDRINFAHANGFRAFISVKGDKDELAQLGTGYYPLFAEALGRIAALGPEAIQVWNEQNIDREWPTGQIDPRAYVEMLRQAHEAIKAVDPSIMVVTGAPAPTGAEGAFGPSRVWNDDRYYQGMANAGAAQYADCIGVHYNEGIIPPQQQGGDPRDGYPTRYLPLMIQRAAFPFRSSSVPLCFSELGYLSPEGYGPLPSGFAWASGTTVAEQAAWLRDAILVAAQFSSAQVALIIVWNVDFDVYTEDDPQGGYAIIRPDGTCPACASIATLRTP